MAGGGKNDHSGHRQRLKSRFAQQGLEGFSDENALELLLFYALPRQDTLPLARALLSRFGSLDGVLEASQEELCTVAGMGESTALFLQLFPALSRRYLIRRGERPPAIATPAQAGAYLLPFFTYAREELVYALFLDGGNCVLACEQVNRGIVNAVEVGVQALIQRALALQSSTLILAHNHPSGIALPSVEDENATLRLKEALSHAGIGLQDHIILAGDQFLSMGELGIL